MQRYPLVQPYDSGLLEVGDGNAVYWETVGAETGVPALYLHGGPGGGCGTGARRYFDPAHYRAVLFDQRGCGRSTPLADNPQVELATNTTAALVTDIEALRAHLGIDRWVVVGVSWGVTLGLVYAQAHPERVRAMVLGAVTSGSRQETEWITRDVGRIFPRHGRPSPPRWQPPSVAETWLVHTPGCWPTPILRCAKGRPGRGVRGRTPTSP